MTDDKKRILFVDDDKSVISELRRIFHSKKLEWKIEFVSNASDALSAMRKKHYDIIISGLLTSGMNGVVLLEKIRSKYPDTIRFMLAGCGNKNLIDKAVRCVHQFISKPCSADALEQMIERSFELRERLHTEKMRAVLSNIRSLPVIPAAYQQVIESLMEPGVSQRQIGRAIAKDPGMSAKLLQVVNSAFYGLNNRITDTIHAVRFLGLKTVEGFILADGIFSKMSQQTVRRFGINGLQEHCIRVGALARRICSSIGMTEEDIDVANMAGIMHDTGTIIMISEFPDQFAESIEISRAVQRPLWEIESELIGLTHSEIGGCLMELWGLPDVIIEATTYHHDPDRCLQSEFCVLSAVYIADVLDHHFCSGIGGGVGGEMNMNYLDKIGVADKLPGWTEMHLPIGLEEYCSVC